MFDGASAYLKVWFYNFCGKSVLKLKSMQTLGECALAYWVYFCPLISYYEEELIMFIVKGLRRNLAITW